LCNHVFPRIPFGLIISHVSFATSLGEGYGGQSVAFHPSKLPSQIVQIIAFLSKFEMNVTIAKRFADVQLYLVF
jgi:hypothetical protein